MSAEKNQNNFGVPKVSYDPMETIGMEGGIFRGMTDPKKNKSLFVRVISIALSVMFFLLPGIAGLILFSYILFSLQTMPPAQSSEYLVLIAGSVFLVLFSVLFMWAGCLGIKANIRRF